MDALYRAQLYFPISVYIPSVHYLREEPLLIDVAGKDEAIETTEAWVDLAPTLDTDTIRIVEEPAVEYVDSSIIDEFDWEEIRLICE